MCGSHFVSLGHMIKHGVYFEIKMAAKINNGGHFETKQGQ